MLDAARRVRVAADPLVEAREERVGDVAVRGHVDSVASDGNNRPLVTPSVPFPV